MKACPNCHRLYPADAGFCANDGGGLLPHENVPAQHDPEDRLLGTQLCGRYEVRRIVADGGMGRVYEARDAMVDGRVAIKVLHAEVARDPVSLERFKREYEISKDLPHDHIVKVLDFQQAENGQFILVMEFLEGEELREVLRRETKVDPARLVRILAQVAIGLDEAHRREFVHRDLKPDNLFLCGTAAGDVVKILDFGSARINKNRAGTKLTSLGTTIGSPWYMSPEQAQGAESLDHRADVFALAAIMYESLVGRVPFDGTNGPSILLAILTRNPPPISTCVPEMRIPAALDDVVDDALAKKPEMRTSTVGAFADAFGRAFGLAGDHHTWANTPLPELQRLVEEARARAPTAAPVVVADPFAADPFASPRAPQGAPPPNAFGGGFGGGAPPPMAAPDPRMAMDAAFDNAAMEPAGLSDRPIALYVLGALVALGVIGGAIFALSR